MTIAMLFSAATIYWAAILIQKNNDNFEENKPKLSKDERKVKKMKPKI